MRITCCSLLVGFAVTFSHPAAGQDKASPEAASQGRTYRVSGVVTDAGRQPLAEVVITAGDTGASALSVKTDGRGRFELGQFRPGTLSVHIRRLGYEQRTVQVDVGAGGEPSSVEIVLLPVPQELEHVYVTASSPGKLSGFYERKQQRGTFGRFLEQEEIRRLGPRNASDLLRNVPGISFAAGPNGGHVIRMRGCQPMVRVDDQRVPGAELDEVVSPSDIAAMEVYSSAAGVPAQYVERGNRLCGLILVWTKTY
jgi:Carboxypeptidase regulatory-like domain/TonB-dependent Receptor Plug Domain